MTSPSSAAPLAKATLYRLLDTPQSNAAKPTPPTVDTTNVVTVQFNPTSLKISYTNETSGGETTKGQAKQSPVQGHSTLTFDLEFDTAEGENGQPVDVRDKTAKVLEFVRPPKENPANPPPRIRFVWGAFVFNGIVNSVNEEIDYFDADGRALRAKLSLSIKEQNLDFEVNKSGPANRNANAASKPGEPARTGGPGSGPTKNPLQTIAAQAGESVQQALSRVNALPEQWRSAMGGLQSPLNLAAGTPIQLGPEVSATAGTATTAFGADQLLPTDSSISGAVSASEEVSAGFSLAASGGIGDSVSAVAAARTSAETSSARGAFSVPPAAPTAVPTAQAGGRARGVHDIDRRSETYGRAVPLRARPQVYGRPAPPAAGRRSGDACRHTMG